MLQTLIPGYFSKSGGLVRACLLPILLRNREGHQRHSSYGTKEHEDARALVWSPHWAERTLRLSLD